MLRRAVPADPRRGGAGRARRARRRRSDDAARRRADGHVVHRAVGRPRHGHRDVRRARRRRAQRRARRASRADPRSRVSGAAVDATGVGPGFSGSPVICPGADGVRADHRRDLGDRSASTAGARCSRRRSRRSSASRSTRRRQRALDGARRGAALAPRSPLATPISIGGLAPAARRRCCSAPRAAPAAPCCWRRAHARRPRRSRRRRSCPARRSPSATRPATSAPARSARSPTSTATPSGRFGHPFDGAGRRELFLQAAYVYGVVDNPLATGDVGDLQARLAARRRSAP